MAHDLQTLLLVWPWPASEYVHGACCARGRLRNPRKNVRDTGLARILWTAFIISWYVPAARQGHSNSCLLNKTHFESPWLGQSAPELRYRHCMCIVLWNKRGLDCWWRSRLKLQLSTLPSQGMRVAQIFAPRARGISDHHG